MKKKIQLGLNPSTARQRLIKNLMFKMMNELGQNKCFHCGGRMAVEQFSIEHKTPWLDSADPVAMYFDLENISFSHLSCNSRASRKAEPVPKSIRAAICYRNRKAKMTPKEILEKRRARP